MNDKDWQARALEVAQDYNGRKDECDLLQQRILTFAREYAAEALAEVERLRAEVLHWKNEVDSANADFENVSQELAHAGSLMSHDTSLIADLRAQLAASGAVKVPDGWKLLGYANSSRIKMTCANKPGGAHLGQVAIYAGESVDPMVIQEQESPTFMGEPDCRPTCYSCGCRSDNPRDWQGRSICSKCKPPAPPKENG